MGTFSSNGKCILHFFKDNMTNSLYEEILVDYLPEFKGICKGDIKILMDNHSVHKSMKSLLFYKEHKIKVIDFPPYYPDLNPIENILGKLKRDTVLILILLAIVHGKQEIEVSPNDAAKSRETLAKSHWLKPLRGCQNLMGISLLPIQIRFWSGARKTSLSFCITNYNEERISDIVSYDKRYLKGMG